MLAVGAPGDVDAEVDLWRRQTIYNTSQADGIMKAYEKAYPSSKAGQKTAPVTPTLTLSLSLSLTTDH